MVSKHLFVILRTWLWQIIKVAMLYSSSDIVEMSEQAADRAHHVHIYYEICTVRIEQRASLVILTRIIQVLIYPIITISPTTLQITIHNVIC